jgi:hypothetical protein
MQWIAKKVCTADAELISAATLRFTNLRYFKLFFYQRVAQFHGQIFQ